MADRESGQDRVSVVITTKNNCSFLPTLFNSIRAQSVSPGEVIVVDNYSTDETCETARRYGARTILSGPERSAQRNAGASASTSESLFFIDADMELSSRVIERCTEMLHSCDAVCIREITVSGDNYWAKARALERDCYFGSVVFEAARAFKRSAFMSLGGYDTSLTGLEDMDLQARLIEGGYKLGWMGEPIFHHEENVGPILYLSKRTKYARTDRVYARKHPNYWARQSSLARIRVMLRSISTRQPSEVFMLLPGLVFERGLEYVLRVRINASFPATSRTGPS